MNEVSGCTLKQAVQTVMIKQCYEFDKNRLHAEVTAWQDSRFSKKLWVSTIKLSTYFWIHPLVSSCLPSLHMRWTVPLLLQWEGSRFTRNLGFNLATSPCKTFGMVCLSSSSYFRFRGEATGALCKIQSTKGLGENTMPTSHLSNILQV